MEGEADRAPKPRGMKRTYSQGESSELQRFAAKRQGTSDRLMEGEADHAPSPLQQAQIEAKARATNSGGLERSDKEKSGKVC